VDDDAGLRRLVQRALARRGFDVVTAGDAEEGLAMLAAERFDLVAIDHHMPGRSGREMLDDIIALPDHPAVVFVTGNDDTSVAVEAIHAGALDFVVKTVGESFFDLLASRFRQTLTRAELERQKRAAEEDLRRANERLQLLMREVHHRVSNSLQMASSFVALQAKQATAPEARDALEATQTRIHAIAKVHHRLYTRDDLTTIDLDDYLGTLVDDLRRSVDKDGRNIEIGFRADPITVPPDEADSIGVVVNGLFGNAAKYAFDGTQPGVIDIVLERAGSGYQLTVSDDGSGFDPASKARGTGLGMRIMTAVSTSLGCKIEYVPSARGTTVRFRVNCAQA